MRKTIIAVAVVLVTVLTVWVVVRERTTNGEAPHSAVIVLAGTHHREGVGQFTAISISDRQKIGTLESFFPNYREFPSSDIAAGWKSGCDVYFNFANGRTVRVTVSKNDDGKTWSIGHGDFRTHGDFDGYVKELLSLPPQTQRSLDSTGDPVASSPATSPPMMTSTPFMVRPILKPKVESAETAEVAEDDEVIGVTIDGHHRAYLVKALSTMLTHVIDDLVEDVPVTVTYCDRTECARVFTSTKRGQPLVVGLGGWLEKGGMLLFYGGRFFPQTGSEFLDKTEPVPLDDLPFEKTTWKEWKAGHPDSEVFVGLPP